MFYRGGGNPPQLSIERLFMERVRILKERPINTNGKFVLYWMQSSVRVPYNFALFEAIRRANELKKPLLVLFVLFETFPYSNKRHFKFLLEGLKEVCEELNRLKIRFVVLHEEPTEAVLRFSKDAAILITDFGYTKPIVELRKRILEDINIPVIAVEDNVVVPVEVTSNKEEYGAYTIRRKIEKHLNEFLKEENLPTIESPYYQGIIFSVDVRNVNHVLERLHFTSFVNPVSKFIGGYSNAKALLKDFIENKLPYYKEKKNDFSEDFTSNLSPYLHFGQISPVEVALEVLKSSASIENKNAFLDELIVRRELAVNFVYYNPHHDRLEGLQPWAYETLKKHQFDEKPYRYSLYDFENAKTHDDLWNAAQMELVKTGKIHGYLRMYWGKKVIEWTESLEIAFKYLVDLNNKYALDGRDPNTYASIAWCFGKHDRPFKERPILGKVRYLSENSIRKKFNYKAYIEKISKL